MVDVLELVDIVVVAGLVLDDVVVVVLELVDVGLGVPCEGDVAGPRSTCQVPPKLVTPSPVATRGWLSRKNR